MSQHNINISHSKDPLMHSIDIYSKNRSDTTQSPSLIKIGLSLISIILIIILLFIYTMIKVTHITQLEIENQYLVKDIANIQRKITALSNTNTLKGDIDLLTSQVSKKKNDLDYIMSSIYTIQSQMQPKAVKLSLLQMSSSSVEITREERNRVNVIKENVKMVEEELNSKMRMIGSLQNQIKVYKERLLKDKGNNNHEPSGNPSIESIGIDTKIIKDQDYVNLLYYWMGPINDYAMILLYRGSEHDFSAKVFHEKCDRKSNTIVLLNTPMGIIGGFSRSDWGTNGYQGDIMSFLFNLTKERKYMIDLSQFHNAIFADNNRLPSFGRGDLTIHHKTIRSTFPIVYGNQWSSEDMTNGYSELAYDELEVFQVLTKTH